MAGSFDLNTILSKVFMWKSVIGVKDHMHLVNIHSDGDFIYEEPELNSIGHRGPEPKDGLEFLAVGCSVTYGVGLSHEETWPSMLAGLMGVSDNYGVIAYPGRSLDAMLRQIIEYLSKYGIPKRIVILAPDDERVDDFGLDEKINGLLKSNRSQVEKKMKTLTFDYLIEPIKSDGIYDPIPASELYVSYRYATSLIQLVRICNLLGIELYWSSWSYSGIQSIPYLRSLDTALDKSYVELTHVSGNGEFFEQSSPVVCHESLNTSERFYIADDKNHYGSHYHAHVAEDFFDAIDYSHG